jgi:hypothetical protein
MDVNKNLFPEYGKSFFRPLSDCTTTIGRDCKELQNCGGQILKLRNPVPQLFLVRNSASDFVVHNMVELLRCRLKLRMPTFDSHRIFSLWFLHKSATYETLIHILNFSKLVSNLRRYLKKYVLSDVRDRAEPK